METSLALTIIGSVLILVGVIFNVIQKVVNQKIMGDLCGRGSESCSSITNSNRWLNYRLWVYCILLQ